MTWSMIGRVSGCVVLLIVLASLVDSLIRPGPRCEACGGGLRVTVHRDDEKMEVTYYECVNCGGLSYDHRFKLGADVIPTQIVGHLPKMNKQSPGGAFSQRSPSSP